jgi:hypothetical protein
LIKPRLFPLLLTAVFLLNACGVQATPAPTLTPTAIPSPTKRIPVGTDIKVDLPEGDLERGADQARLKSCIHCHVDAIATRFESDGDMPKITERGEVRIADPAYNGNATTNEEYILESILLPEIYIVPGTPSGAAMPTNFDELLTKQDLADLLLWLSTFE